ncbi:ATP-binding cassette sub- A member 3 [Schistosoma haematobium]|uniref:ATP-binding cassette sub- A member 3 n=1 Tax=Schistosoma haematobium TaxID=6185 RepID=A0A922LL41_SCHHA|nr:ATP-binding cassette sub- A member 3 [Schistosoma haematobium]KAH9588252.1 ATP-binding cassette sub- A member 3 [Schistosoma haematobium]
MESKVACDFARCPVYEHWVSTSFLQPFRARHFIPANHELDDKRRFLRKDILQSLRKVQEVWWLERANNLEAAAASGNCRKLLRLIRVTGSKQSGAKQSVKLVGFHSNTSTDILDDR